MWLASVAACFLASTTPAPVQPLADGAVLLVRAPTDAAVEAIETSKGTMYRAGRVSTDTRLPVGYPAPTAPGAIEIKRYPQVRRATVSGDGAMDRAGASGFWPLFLHISRRDIAMTAPVETELRRTNDAGSSSWTMAFLYHSPDDGQAGTDGRITIEDAEPVTVLALGVRGRVSMRDPFMQVAELESWLEEHGEHWIADGDVRVLGYNGPNVRAADQWWEVQLPIRPAARQSEAPAGS
ncbi:MAG: heme-binding protein [Phycisphaerales bacterium JB039]